MSKRLRCWLGIHEWLQSRPLSVYDAFPMAGVQYQNPTRECLHCGKAQYWLPGYGGSEFGCWQPLR